MGYGNGQGGGMGKYNIESHDAAKGSKRRKNVFSTDKIAGLWLSQSQDAARNTLGNYYFADQTIYSYGRHFPIARLTDKYLNGKRVVLYTAHTYSCTTAKHLHDVSWTLRRNSDQFVVLCVDDVQLDFTPEVVREEYVRQLKQYEAWIERAKNARQNQYHRLGEAERIRESINMLCAVFAAKDKRCRPLKPPPTLEADFTKAAERRAYYEKLRLEAVKRRERLRELAEFERKVYAAAIPGCETVTV